MGGVRILAVEKKRSIGQRTDDIEELRRGVVRGDAVLAEEAGAVSRLAQQRNGFFEAVTLADVKRVAAKYMKPEHFTFVMVGQPALD